MEYFNIDQYKDEFPVLEAGEYLATISKVEDYSGQSGTTTLLIQFRTEGGSVRMFLGIYNDDADKRRKAYVRLANIARACGLGGRILPTDLIGKSLMIEVTKSLDQNNRYRNDVGFNFRPAPGGMPIQDQPQSAPAAPQAPAAPASSGLPWD